ncbi:MAG TPA: leucine--tRNA ligase, partial [Cytophagales bacterium]|nr:leucine--tRNA ligase [Cytophagales bacterium]
GLSKRGGHPVLKKNVKQWILNITQYADRLLDGLDDFDWSDEEKEKQRNHIGRAEGVNIKFGMGEDNDDLEVFTTKPETINGVTFIVLSLDHPQLDSIITDGCKEDVDAYIRKSEKQKQLSHREKAKLGKTGVSTGSCAIHPITKQEIPIWVADYVTSGYATDGVMGVPSGDDRDKDFAEQYDLPVISIYEDDHYKKEDGDTEGVLRNSDTLDGLNETEARAAIIQKLEEEGTGNQTVNYRMHDWVFSRQRFWGEPFPVIHMPDGSIALVDDADLPLELPAEPNYPPDNLEVDGNESDEVTNILDRSEDWAKTDEGTRETNTMPGAAGSSWYFMRYIDPHNADEFAASEKLNAWLPVDLYMGGSEHTTGHVLYARFWHMVLHDAGLVDSPEPFKKIVNQGLVMGEDGEKMSKSKGNAVSVDETIDEYGADVLRVYTMFLGGYGKTARWDRDQIAGVERLIDNITDIFEKISPDAEMDDKTKRDLHICIKTITDDTSQLKFNTAISGLMKFVNKDLKGVKEIPPELANILCRLIAPYAPMLAEELWCNVLGEEYSVHKKNWPEYDETLTTLDTVEIVIQINGKLKTVISVDATEADNEEVISQQAQTVEKIRNAIGGKQVNRQIFVPGNAKRSGLMNYIVK